MTKLSGERDFSSKNNSFMNIKQNKKSIGDNCITQLGGLGVISSHVKNYLMILISNWYRIQNKCILKIINR